MQQTIRYFLSSFIIVPLAGCIPPQQDEPVQSGRETVYQSQGSGGGSSSYPAQSYPAETSYPSSSYPANNYPSGGSGYSSPTSSGSYGSTSSQGYNQGYSQGSGGYQGGQNYGGDQGGQSYSGYQGGQSYGGYQGGQSYGGYQNAPAPAPVYQGSSQTYQSGGDQAQTQVYPSASAGLPSCYDCGVVENIQQEQEASKESGVGALAGAGAGALLGNQFGHGTGKTIATVVGGLGGAYAGHKVEGKVREGTYYLIFVRMNSGRVNTYRQESPPNFGVNTLVRVSNGVVLPM